VIVVDATVVVAALVATDTDGAWAAGIVCAGPMAAPHLMPVEAAAVLRRSVIRGQLDPSAARLAHDDLSRLRVDLYPYQPLAERVWSLRDNVTTYDGWYVALAEALGVGLATLDRRLALAPGPACPFLTPP